jgi:hypothetical protein
MLWRFIADIMKTVGIIPIIIALLLELNYTKSLDLWGFLGLLACGFLLAFLSIIWFVFWIVIIGCGYMTYNYLHLFQGWNIYLSIILGLFSSYIIFLMLNAGMKRKGNYF